MTPAYQTIRWGLIAEQLAHRLGSLSLLALCTSLPLMLAAKRPFIPLLACAFAAATLATLSTYLSLRWHPQRPLAGLLTFNLTLTFLSTLAMLASRLDWWHLVGLLAPSIGAPQ
jgi:hypothetical protein